MASLCFVPYSKIDILNDAKSVNTKNPQDPVVDLIKKAFASVSPTGVILTPTIYSDGLPKSGSHIDDETLATVIKSYTTGETCSIRVKYSASYFMLDASALSSLASDDYFISCIKGFGSNVDMLFSAELDDYPMIGLNKYSVNYSSTKYKLNTI
jgi:hypothetical protein